MKKEDWWISIEDQQPDDGQRVIMVGVYYNFIGAEYKALTFGQYWPKLGKLLSTDPREQHLKGTHWMPLPEMPKSDTE